MNICISNIIKYILPKPTIQPIGNKRETPSRIQLNTIKYGIFSNIYYNERFNNQLTEQSTNRSTDQLP